MLSWPPRLESLLRRHAVQLLAHPSTKDDAAFLSRAASSTLGGLYKWAVSQLLHACTRAPRLPLLPPHPSRAPQLLARTEYAAIVVADIVGRSGARTPD